MVYYLDWHVVVLSVIQTETDKLVKYDVMQRWPLRTCAGCFEQPSYSLTMVSLHFCIFRTKEYSIIKAWYTPVLKRDY